MTQGIPARFSDVEMIKFHEEYVLHKQQEQATMAQILIKLDKIDADTAGMIKAWSGVVALSKLLTWVSGIMGISVLIVYIRNQLH